MNRWFDEFGKARIALLQMDDFLGRQVRGPSKGRWPYDSTKSLAFLVSRLEKANNLIKSSPDKDDPVAVPALEQMLDLAKNLNDNPNDTAINQSMGVRAMVRLLRKIDDLRRLFTAQRVVERFKLAAGNFAETQWLPDLLGAKKSLVDGALKAIKIHTQNAGPFDSKDGKAPAGGIVYFLLEVIREAAAAKKLWNLLDMNGGLDTDRKWEDTAHRIEGYLSHDLEERKVQAAGICVSLLMRTRQQTKAERVNAFLSHEFAKEIAAAAGNMGGPQPKAPRKKTPMQNLIGWVKDKDVQAQVGRAVSVIGKDAAKAAQLVIDVLEDVNAHRGANAAEGALAGLLHGAAPAAPEAEDAPSISASSIGQAFDWGVNPAYGFGIALLQAVGYPAAAKALANVAIEVDGSIFTSD